MRFFNLPKLNLSKIKLKLPFFKSKKSDSDKINLLKIRANVKGLSKIFDASKKLEVRIEVVKALAEIGSVDALVTLHGYSSIPTEPSLHDEIMMQFSKGMSSFLRLQSKTAALKTRTKKAKTTGKMHVRSLDPGKAFNFVTAAFGKLFHLASSALGKLGHKSKKESVPKEAVKGKARRSIDFSKVFHGIGAVFGKLFHSISSAFSKPIHIRSKKKNVPKESDKPSLHDEIMMQFSKGMSSFLRLQSKTAALKTRTKKAKTTGKMHVRSLDPGKAFNFVTAAFGKLFHLASSALGKLGHKSKKESVPKEAVKGKARRSIDFSKVFHGIGAVFGKLFHSISSAFSKPIHIRSKKKNVPKESDSQ